MEDGNLTSLLVIAGLLVLSWIANLIDHRSRFQTIPVRNKRYR
jgi:hypothetical protein